MPKLRPLPLSRQEPYLKILVLGGRCDLVCPGAGGTNVGFGVRVRGLPSARPQPARVAQFEMRHGCHHRLFGSDLDFLFYHALPDPNQKWDGGESERANATATFRRAASAEPRRNLPLPNRPRLGCQPCRRPTAPALTHCNPPRRSPHHGREPVAGVGKIIARTVIPRLHAGDKLVRQATIPLPSLFKKSVRAACIKKFFLRNAALHRRQEQG